MKFFETAEEKKVCIMLKRISALVAIVFLVFAVSAHTAKVISIGTAPAGGAWYANGDAFMAVS